MIQHEFGDEIEMTTHRIIYPGSADHLMNTGLIAELIRLRGKPYADMRKLYVELDRQKMIEQSGFFFSVSLPIVIVPVKAKPTNNPAVEASVIGKKVAVQCKKYGCTSVALQKSRWNSMKYNAAQFQELIDAFEKAGIEVHVYE